MAIEFIFILYAVEFVASQGSLSLQPPLLLLHLRRRHSRGPASDGCGGHMVDGYADGVNKHARWSAGHSRYLEDDVDTKLDHTKSIGKGQVWLKAEKLGHSKRGFSGCEFHKIRQTSFPLCQFTNPFDAVFMGALLRWSPCPGIWIMWAPLIYTFLAF